MPLAFLTPPLSLSLSLSKSPKSAQMDHSSMHQNMVGISSCSSQEYHNHHQKKSSPSSSPAAAAAAAIRASPPEQSLRCPRCDSTNTKFCYYNNYSLSQPRYFCKSCRRYWTKGGILRNIPVGGGYRKHKRSSATKSLRTTPEPTHNGSILGIGSNNGYINNEQMDLGLAFALLNKQQPFGGSTFLPEFGTSHQLENANYAFGNGGSGLEEIAAVDPNRALWGFPWQMNIGGANGHSDQIDSGRDVWSSINYINTGALL